MRSSVALCILPVAALQAGALTSPVVSEAVAANTAESAEDRAWSRRMSAAIVANVDGRAITSGDILTELLPVLMTLRQRARNEEEFGRMLDEQGSRIRDGLADKYLIISEAKEKGIRLPPSVIQEQIDEMITTRYNGDRAEYFRALHAQGRTPLDDRKAMEEDLLVSIVRNQGRRTTAEISPEKIQRFYEANKDGFTQPAGVKLSEIILWPGAADTDADVRKVAAQAIAELDKGVPFADVAKKYSKDDSRERGGEGDWRDISQLNADIAKVVATLKDGDHTKAIEYMVGGRLNIYIYRRDASRAEGPRPIAEVREIIEDKLFKDAARERDDEWKLRLRRHFFVRYYND